MQQHRKLISLGLTCFLFFLITLFPARAGFMLLAPAGIQGFGFEGTLWQGSVRVLNVAGQQLRNTEWSLSIPGLFAGRIGGDFKTRWGSGFAEGNGSISLMGTVRLSEARAGFAAAMLGQSFGAPDLGGQVNLQIDTLQLSDNWPKQLIGTANINNLSSPLLGRGSAGQIGNYTVSFDSSTATDPDLLTGTITDNGGPLEVSGELALRAPGDYELETRIKPRSSAPEKMQKNLEFLGPPEADGTRIFEFAGSI